MKVLSLNTWAQSGPWEKRWDVLIKGLEDLNPDLIGFQEIFEETYLRDRIKDLYPHYYFSVPPAGNVIVSRFPILDKHCQKLKTKSPTETYDRYVVYAKISCPKGPVHFFNTHLSWKPSEGLTRQAQAEEILEFINAAAGSGESVVAGDFNASPDSPEIIDFVKSGKWKDAYLSVGKQKNEYTWHNINPFAKSSSVFLPDRRIDYIFYRQPKAVLNRLISCEIVLDQPAPGDLYASDHFGVLAEWGP